MKNFWPQFCLFKLFLNMFSIIDWIDEYVCLCGFQCGEDFLDEIYFFTIFYFKIELFNMIKFRHHSCWVAADHLRFIHYGLDTFVDCIMSLFASFCRWKKNHLHLPSGWHWFTVHNFHNFFVIFFFWEEEITFINYEAF